MCGGKTRKNLSVRRKFQPIRRMRFYLMPFSETDGEIVREWGRTLLWKPELINLE